MGGNENANFPRNVATRNPVQNQGPHTLSVYNVNVASPDVVVQKEHLLEQRALWKSKGKDVSFFPYDASEIVICNMDFIRNAL